MRVVAVAIALAMGFAAPATAQDVSGSQSAPGLEELRQSFDAAMLRLRGPIIDQALDACLTGETTIGAAMQRAIASGWPPFETLAGNGLTWRTSQAPTSESTARIGLMLADAPSQLRRDRRELKCVILGPAGLEAAFRDRLAARIPGGASSFTMQDGHISAATPGSSVQVGPGGRIGLVDFERADRQVAITIELMPVQ